MTEFTTSDNHPDPQVIEKGDDGQDTEEDYPSFRGVLSEGFQYLRSKREGKDENHPPGCILPTFLHHVSVNFIDPTTSSIATTSSTTTHQPVHLYEKFCEIFEREYQSTLSYVPYQLFRNNSNGVIERLPIRTVVARSHGGGVLLPDDDAAKSAVHDFSWERPYCYVYLAACESLEHYRTKVKPSIQAFVSQLDAANNRSKTRRSAGGMTNSAATTPDSPAKTRKRYTASPRYVIIYVPTGDRGEDVATAANNGTAVASTAAATTSTNKTTGLASRFAAAARQRMATRGGAGDQQDSSVHSNVDSSVHDSTDDDGTASTAATAASQKLSKTERETAKRFNQDFPSGNVCTLSHLSNNASSGNGDSAWEKLEWNTVMKAMGVAISGGFQDRCNRFDEQLRKLDLQRRGDAKPTSDEDATRFHLVNFFLVKESLAFTYEQMRLPAEALLQYEELRAFLPDTEAKVKFEESELALLRVALTADVLDFRSSLRDRAEFDEVSASVVEDYIFARELALLFQMHKSVRIAKRSVAFVRAKFNALRPMVADSEELAWLLRHCFGFCWDFRIATQPYIEGQNSKSNYHMAFARTTCDLLEFARSCFLALGKDIVDGEPLVTKVDDLVCNLQGPWEPWSETVATNGSASVHQTVVTEPFLKHALDSKDAYRRHYLELTSHIASFNEVCGRQRFAARLRIQRMELFDALGDKEKAAAELQSIIDVYEEDAWSTCQFSLIFRLATFRRTFRSAPEYLDVLVRCFSKRLSAVAPKRALDALHDDLLRVIQSESTKGLVLSVPPLFGPIFGLEGVISHKAPGTDRSLLKRLYTLGDSVSVTLSLSSFLPGGIQLDCIAVNLVPFQTYVAAMEDNLPVKESDVVRRLALDKPDELKSGENTYTLDWLPSSPGQYILASCAFHWNGVCFSYSAKELKRPTIRIDIVPGKPTQRLNVTPSYLLPGHEQKLKFELCSGSDAVESGVLQIIGSSGVTLKPQSEHESQWVESTEVTLPACPPNESVSVEVLAKAVFPEPDVTVQPLQATLSTSYKCAGNEADDAELMETDLETNIPVRTTAVLCVHSSGFIPCGPGRATLSIVLQCNAPAPFRVQDWKLHCPAFVRLDNPDEDLNASIRGETVSAADRIFFCFNCVYDETHQGSGTAPSLSITFTNESGVEFTEMMSIDASWPAMHSKTIDAFGGQADVKATLSATTGNIGHPIELTYTIDCSSLSERVFYAIDFDHSSWIVNGNIEGQVDLSTSSFSVKTVAIPAQPGEVQGLPSLSLLQETGSGLSRIRTQIAPTIFTANPPQEHSSVAFPIKGITRRGFSPRSKAGT